MNRGAAETFDGRYTPPMSDFPPCGLYRTTQPIAEIPAGRLVYFHNHGNPGPGLYLPKSWRLNGAKFNEQGTTLTDPAEANGLSPLAAEGFYRVKEDFTCCEKNCTKFEKGLMVQLGYDGEAKSIVFVPQWTAAGFAIPETGSVIDQGRVSKLELLKVSTPVAEHTHAGREDLQ